METATVRFVDQGDDLLSLVEIETPLRAQGLEDLWWAFYSLRVQIVSSHVRVAGGKLIQRAYLCEFDGAALQSGREAQLKTSLLQRLRPIANAKPKPATTAPLTAPA